MELRVLRYFLTIAQEENITRAADILHVTQPTLSRQIMQLEDELGVKLFKRGKYSMKLTDDGLFLKKRAEEILTLADRTEKAITNKEKEISGEISIACTETHSMEVLAERMEAFRALHPGVYYSMETANVDRIREIIDKGLADIGLMTEPVDTKRFDTIRVPTKERWGAIVRADSPLAEKAFVYPEDLADKSLIIPIRTEVQYTLEGWLGKSFSELDVAARYNLGRNVAVMIQNNLGAGIGLDLFSSYEGLKFIPMIPPLMTGSVLCWKKNQVFSQVAGAFIEYLKNSL